MSQHWFLLRFLLMDFCCAKFKYSACKYLSLQLGGGGSLLCDFISLTILKRVVDFSVLLVVRVEWFVLSSSYA